MHKKISYKKHINIITYMKKKIERRRWLPCPSRTPAAAGGVLGKETARAGRRLGWASARSGAAHFFFKYVPRKNS